VTEQGAADGAELLVCDSSFVGAVAQRRQQPKRVAHRDATVLDRIDRARNAISVVTLAEGLDLRALGASVVRCCGSRDV
jgi:hypothetical protein